MWTHAATRLDGMGRFIGKVSFENDFDGDDDNWVITKPITYITDKGAEITVKPGAVTDGASIPKILSNLIPRLVDPNVTAAAIIHDQLYRTSGANIFTRAQSDNIFRCALQDAGETAVKAWLMWAGVRLGGWSAWRWIPEQMFYIEVKK